MDAACWTVSIGAVPHSLGDRPEACLTCAAKRAEDAAKAQAVNAQAAMRAQRERKP